MVAKSAGVLTPLRGAGGFLRAGISLVISCTDMAFDSFD
jgi:hypothetical protein